MFRFLLIYLPVYIILHSLIIFVTLSSFFAGPKDVAIFTNTVNFDALVIQVLPILYVGASLVVVKPKGHLDPAHVVDLVLAHTVTSFVVSVPTMAREYMAEFKRRKLAQYKPMRAWALGGDAVPVGLVHQMQEVSFLFSATL